ncbi:MAG: CDP-diacylglycerol--glycerol-3-phosphate 3-phosphatidyltransferase [Oscillospiraceae bacterium]|nr:CDP-diacylglycerol--glycerol-3-phosphate 3-phosphatidyltransferase [Oscillospiraceae bacterium]
MKKHIPNILTIIRILLIPFIVFFIAKSSYLLAFILLLASGLTDILDGFIARRFNLISDFGKLMDPLADKLTQISIVITLVIKGFIPFWIVIIIILKEFIMVSGASFLYGNHTVVSSRWFGKLATVVLYIAIFFSIIIAEFNLPEIYKTCNFYLYCISIIAMIFSLIMYFRLFIPKDLLKNMWPKN